MAFRKETYRLSCVACPELTDLVCRVCNGPACETHNNQDLQMCTDCGAALLERLAAEGLTRDDLAFRTPPDFSKAASETIASWNAHTERTYRARFVLARLRNSRRRK